MSSVMPLLKHNPSVQDPAVLEAITVQREPVIASLVDCVLDTDGGLRHQLLIGPRGMGKTHILSLVVSRVRDDERAGRIAIAWLDEDPWPIRSYDKFLAAILAKVAEQLEDPKLAEQAAELRSSDGTRWLEGEEALRQSLGDRRLVLLVENLDEVFRRIGSEGQARLRALLENWRQALVIATSPQLFEGVHQHESPFYGFFAITHLQELSLESATELMTRVAELRQDGVLLEYLRSDAALRRLAAVEALAGGHPRIWLLLSGCVSVDAIDELVPLFLEALDELTPYYQDRLRELSDQQQEIVVLLSEAGGALSNRALAERSGIAQNQIATIIRHLSDRGYVRSAEVPGDLVASGDNRMSYWELREPLMRLCLDVKQARGEPLRMVVAFLRAWYGSRLLDELVRLPAEAKLAKTYVREAFRSLDETIPMAVIFRGSPGEVLSRAEAGLSVAPDRNELRLAQTVGLMADNRYEEARQAIEELRGVPGVPLDLLQLQLLLASHALEEIDSDALVEQVGTIIAAAGDDPNVAIIGGLLYVVGDRADEALATFESAADLAPSDMRGTWGRALALQSLGRHEEALEGLAQMAERFPDVGSVRGLIGDSLSELGRHEEALATFAKAVELEPENAGTRAQMGEELLALKRAEEAVEAFDRAIDLDPDSAMLQARKAAALIVADRSEEALEALDRASELEPDSAITAATRAAVLISLDREREALEAMRQAVELDPVNARLRMLFAEWTLSAGDAANGLRILREAVASADPANGEKPVPDAEFLCRTTWRVFEAGEQRRELLAGIAEVCVAAGAADELGRGLVNSIPLFVDEEVPIRDAEAWIEDWESVPGISTLEIPIRMLRAALEWKRDKDRAHLLDLPSEQREILAGLLQEATVE